MQDYKKLTDTQKTSEVLIQKAKARQVRSKRSLFLNAAVLGIYGWHVTMPVILGIICGKLLDKYIPLPPMSWTFNCILIGFFVGVYTANKWLNTEGYKKNIKTNHINKLKGKDKNV